MINKILKNDFLKKIFEGIFGKASQMIFSLLFSFVTARLYGAEVLGEYTYIFALLSMFTILAKCGMDNGLVYFIPKVGNRYISFSFFISFIISVIIFIFGFLFLKNDLLKISLPLVWLLSMEQMFLGIYKVDEKIKDYFLTISVIGLLSRIILIIILYKILGANTKSLMLGLLISLIATNGVFIFKNFNRFEKVIFEKKFLKYSIPLVMATVMGVVMSKIDIIMLKNFVDSKSIGVYQIAAQLATATSALLLIFNMVFAPKISKLYHENKIEVLKKLYIKSTRILGGLALVTLIIMIIMRKYILGIYGSTFILGEMVLVYRGIGQFFNSVVGSSTFMISMTGRPKIFMWITSIACIINIILNLILIPKFGINGAAIASMVAVITTNVVGYIVVKHIFELKVYKIF